MKKQRRRKEKKRHLRFICEVKFLYLFKNTKRQERNDSLSKKLCMDGAWLKSYYCAV